MTEWRRRGRRGDPGTLVPLSIALVAMLLAGIGFAATHLGLVFLIGIVAQFLIRKARISL